jgi:activator of HSP90 ATPase
MEFTLKTKFNATAKQVYKSWLSTQGHTKMTGGPAYISDKVGDAFTVWDGYIKGSNIELEPYHKIIQSWRSSQFEEQEGDSQIEIILIEIDGQTELILNHTNVPESGAHYKKGWEENYFSPMRNYFEQLN